MTVRLTVAQALVRFLVANASSIDPSLQPLIARLKATPVPATAPADGKPVFGHRTTPPAG